MTFRRFVILWTGVGIVVPFVVMNVVKLPLFWLTVVFPPAPLIMLGVRMAPRSFEMYALGAGIVLLNAFIYAAIGTVIWFGLMLLAGPRPMVPSGEENARRL